ncbi:hypothetical protein IWX49DRAFT_41435 [Phyllosticta citricarpa]|uniref:Uncharacterized protein n=2 Tax=Phyllosticta TaxID=121621 RepID=A0ABR1MG72_9PEZI
MCACLQYMQHTFKNSLFEPWRYMSNHSVTTNTFLCPNLLTSSDSGMLVVRKSKTLHGLDRRRYFRFGKRDSQLNRGMVNAQGNEITSAEFFLRPSTATKARIVLALLAVCPSSARVVPCPCQPAYHADAAAPLQVALDYHCGYTAGGTRLLPCAANLIWQALSLTDEAQTTPHACMHIWSWCLGDLTPSAVSAGRVEHVRKTL